MPSHFADCLQIILSFEGGYVDHPDDPGGATNMGITHKTLARWRNISPWWALQKSDVRALKLSEASSIYRGLYWETCRADELPRGVDLALFDFAVNSGPQRAIQHLQAHLKVRQDGVMGPITLAAAQNCEAAGGASRLIAGLVTSRMGFLRGLSGFAVFGTGWTRRVDKVRAAALAMRPDIEPITQPTERMTKMNLLNGYKTYIVGAIMALAALAQIAGVDLPGLEGHSASQLLMEAFAILFLRKGIKNEIANS